MFGPCVRLFDYDHCMCYIVATMDLLVEMSSRVTGLQLAIQHSWAGLAAPFACVKFEFTNLSLPALVAQLRVDQMDTVV
jgi:hypothetical protein